MHGISPCAGGGQLALLASVQEQWEDGAAAGAAVGFQPAASALRLWWIFGTVISRLPQEGLRRLRTVRHVVGLMFELESPTAAIRRRE